MGASARGERGCRIHRCTLGERHRERGGEGVASAGGVDNAIDDDWRHAHRNARLNDHRPGPATRQHDRTARALGEFGATLTFAGSFPGVTRTMPLAVYAALDVDRSEAIALSVVLLLVSVAILVSLRGQFLQGLRR